MNHTHDSERRCFLKSVAAAGGSGALLAVSGTAFAAETPDRGAETKAKVEGYRETEHVRAYYASARL
jgi:hypothetical protein